MRAKTAKDSRRGEAATGCDFIHFNRRDLRLRFPADPDDPWFAEFQQDFAGFDRPRYHVTRATGGPAAGIRAGDTIWLVGQLYAPWGARLPPTLDARIDVADVRPRRDGRGFRYTAAATSCWFPLAAAERPLRALETVDASGGSTRLCCDDAAPIGRSLRRIRRLASGAGLRRWEAGLRRRSLHFISYRIRDGSRPAFECASRLLERGARVIWDRWSLPRRLAERRELVADASLDRTLLGFVREADIVWGIETRWYGASGSYTLRERELALSLNKYRRYAPTSDRPRGPGI